MRWEWEVIPKLTIFHQHQVYPEMGDMNNYIINSLQGIRFNVYNGLNVSGQVQWNYDNDPAENSEKGDTTVFLTLGYNYKNWKNPMAYPSKGKFLAWRRYCQVNLSLADWPDETHDTPTYQRHGFPSEIISHAVWLYHRFCLSFREVKELLAERS